jgi:Family of unknown function (DUF6141)
LEIRQKLLFREIQRPRQIWIWVLVLSIAIFFWYCFIQQILLDNPIGSNPAPNFVLVILWVVFGIVFPVMLIGFLKLIIEVRVDGIYIRYAPFHLQFRKFSLKDIDNYEPVDYSALQFGGWGIRINLKGERAYNMNGKHGIRLRLKNETVVIGTQKEMEMMNAIDSIIKK